MAFDKSMLGFKVKDIVTGFEGTATSVSHYMNGCTRVGITPNKTTDKGEPGEPHLFDEQQVEILEERVRPNALHVATQPNSTPPPTGGPTDSRREV